MWGQKVLQKTEKEIESEVEKISYEKLSLSVKDSEVYFKRGYEKNEYRF